MLDSVKEESNIVSQLHQQIARYPEKIAMVSADKSISYQAFGAEVEKLAGYIAQHSQDKPVALLLDRSIHTMIAIYGALRANVPYLPIDPANPQERIEFLLQDAGATLLIAESKYQAQAKSFNGSVALIDQVLGADAPATASLPQVSGICLNSPAYIIYTSGSTGKPKGVLCSHKNLNYANDMMLQQFEELGLDEQSKWLWNASYAFDASIKGVVALAQGKCVVVPSDLDVKDPKALCALIAQQQISVVNTPPVLMEYLLPHLIVSETKVDIIVSGDDVSQGLWQKLREYSVANGRKVLNAYGPTEASVNATFEVQSDDEQVNMGRAVVGAELFVLNDKGEAVATGEEGELYIAGNGVALGYLNREQDSKAAFVTLAENTLAFKTGDMVQLLDGGKVKFAGRIDNQVKYRGYRIELDEIQTTLKGHQQVADAAVIAVKAGDDVRIESYLVAHLTQPSNDALEAYLTETLPEYMHPGKLTFVEEIPLTSGGKVDKATLQALTAKADCKVADNNADIEARLSAIWRETLSIDEVSPEDNFFKRGGHSLLAMQLIQKVDAEFGVELEIRELFSLLTLQSQIDWLKAYLDAAEVEFGGADSGVEAKLRGIWLEILNIEQVGGQDNFFKLGGHSLLAMNLLAQMKDEFGVEMDIRELFSHLEFDAQVQWIENAMAAAQGSESEDNADAKVELEL